MLSQERPHGAGEACGPQLAARPADLASQRGESISCRDELDVDLIDACGQTLWSRSPRRQGLVLVGDRLDLGMINGLGLTLGLGRGLLRLESALLAGDRIQGGDELLALLDPAQRPQSAGRKQLAPRCK